MANFECDGRQQYAPPCGGGLLCNYTANDFDTLSVKEVGDGNLNFVFIVLNSIGLNVPRAGRDVDWAGGLNGAFGGIDCVSTVATEGPDSCSFIGAVFALELPCMKVETSVKCNETSKQQQ
ncbi:hypothetical protein Ahy_B02g057569 [Arachis hypogaea]|uniref:Uncharacterized protein n=1 Tax=Arachis hypogaea TaxID=3818 RepID=A0A445ACK5_ARAHY|nr:hypothetical protein Ahy_B02g057569 [Arachis hypogaea]